MSEVQEALKPYHKSNLELLQQLRREDAEASGEVPDGAHVDYGQACRHGCYGHCGTCD